MCPEDRRAPLLPPPPVGLTRSPSGSGKARNSTPETTLNTAVFNPTPIASVSTTVAANPGLRRSKRKA